MNSPSIATSFGLLDWGVVLAYFGLTTLLGARLAGRQATIRDFFLGGRRLPWYAVAGSIVATELSAMTFVIVPYIVFADGGNLTYLQLGVFGALFARLIVAFVLVPAFYAKEIYSPYEYMGARLGPGVRKMASLLFSIGGILAQSSRVYLTAVILELVLHDALFEPLTAATGVSGITWSIGMIGLVAMIWTLLGGISTVIWTDVILFFVFVIGAVVALLTIVTRLDGGWFEILTVAGEAGKLRFFDFDLDPTRSYTIWTAVIANTLFGTGQYGTDQMMAQRMFCCRDQREAKKAILFSYLGQGVTWLVALVGLGLFAFYQAHPLTGEALARFDEDPQRIFPLFIITEIPAGLSGLIVAGIFAAAISSLDSIIAALSQTTMSTFYLPSRRKKGPIDDRRELRIGRVMVVFWTVVLCLMAELMIEAAKQYPNLLDLALSLATYVSGALLAGFLIAFLPLKIDGRGFLFSAPLSVLTVLALAWRQDWAFWVCVGGGATILVLWFGRRRPDESTSGWQSAALTFACLALPVLQRFGSFSRLDEQGVPTEVNLAWPWFSPIGCAVALLFGILLASPLPDHPIRSRQRHGSDRSALVASPPPHD